MANFNSKENIDHIENDLKEILEEIDGLRNRVNMFMCGLVVALKKHITYAGAFEKYWPFPEEKPVLTK